MPGTPLIARSIGINAASMSTDALAPGYARVTETSGGAISGNCEIGRLLIASTPRKMRMSDTTIASTGRRMNFWII